VDVEAEGMRWSHVRASRRGGRRDAGRTAVSADLRDGRSSAGRERPNFCSRARRVREVQWSRAMGLEGSRRPMIPKECIRDEKPGYLRFVVNTRRFVCGRGRMGEMFYLSVPRNMVRSSSSFREYVSA